MVMTVRGGSRVGRGLMLMGEAGEAGEGAGSGFLVVVGGPGGE